MPEVTQAPETDAVAEAFLKGELTLEDIQGIPYEPWKCGILENDFAYLDFG